MYATHDHREVTSRSKTLEEAVYSAVNAWRAGRDGRAFTIVNPSGSTVAFVKRGVATVG